MTHTLEDARLILQILIGAIWGVALGLMYGMAFFARPIVVNVHPPSPPSVSWRDYNDAGCIYRVTAEQFAKMPAHLTINGTIVIRAPGPLTFQAEQILGAEGHGSVFEIDPQGEKCLRNR